jgi:hypothetical protein
MTRRLTTSFQHFAWPLAVTTLLMVVGLSTTTQCQAATLRPPVERMTEVALRDPNAMQTEVRRQRTLWRDSLAEAQKQWAINSLPGDNVPAYALTHMFKQATPSVTVSLLLALGLCESPGNAAGADLFARCPLRIVTGEPGAERTKTIARVCRLFVPPTAPGHGPDPAKNYQTVQLDVGRTLHLRVVQNGHPVPACDLDVAVD